MARSRPFLFAMDSKSKTQSFWQADNFIFTSNTITEGKEFNFIQALASGCHLLLQKTNFPPKRAFFPFVCLLKADRMSWKSWPICFGNQLWTSGKITCIVKKGGKIGAI